MGQKLLRAKQHPKKDIIATEPSILETDIKDEIIGIHDYLTVGRTLEGSK